MDSYFDPRHAGSFGGVAYRHLNVMLMDLLKPKTSKHGCRTKMYTLHKPVRLKVRRRRTFTVGIDDLWQADLVDVSSLSI